MFTHKQAEDRVALGFWIHFGAYLVVTGSLIALNFTRNPDHPWSLWMAAGWALVWPRMLRRSSIPNRGSG